MRRVGWLRWADGHSAVGRTTRSLAARIPRVARGAAVQRLPASVSLRLKGDAFAKCFSAWIAECVASDGEGRFVAIDGKTLRGSYDRQDGRAAIHMVWAWAGEQAVAGSGGRGREVQRDHGDPRVAGAAGTSEAVVTIDAMGCQKEIAAKVRERGGDYVLAVKQNQAKLHAAVREHFNALQDIGAKRAAAGRQTQGKGHGRVEQRYSFHPPFTEELHPSTRVERFNNDRPGDLGHRTRRPGVLGRAVLPEQPDPGREPFRRGVRGHWGIENSLHWVLDVTFREDESRSRDRRLAENLAALRRLAIGLLETTSRQTQPPQQTTHRRLERRLPRRTPYPPNDLMGGHGPGPGSHLNTPAGAHIVKLAPYEFAILSPKQSPIGRSLAPLHG